MRICVLGGCGAMGKVIVSCLLRHDPGVKVTVADKVGSMRKAEGGRRKAEIRRVCFRKVDLFNHAALVGVLKGHAVVINSTSHHFNLPVMRAALAAGVYYLDLGGLFHFTRRQLGLHEAFQRKNLTAILGMGCAPGISNLLALWAAQKMDRVDEIHIKVGGRELSTPHTARRTLHAAFPYAVGTIREELTWKPAIYRKGKWKFERPLHGVEFFKFPSPVGKQRIFWTIHSEIATLPKSFPGLKSSSFKIGFPAALIRAALGKNPVPKPSAHSLQPTAHDSEITLALVQGRHDGKPMKSQAWCRAFGSEGHSAGDWDTAWPPAVVAGMLARGEIVKRGVFPPEKIVPLEPFFEKLKCTGFLFHREVTTHGAQGDFSRIR